MEEWKCKYVIYAKKQGWIHAIFEWAGVLPDLREKQHQQRRKIHKLRRMEMPLSKYPEYIQILVRDDKIYLKLKKEYIAASRKGFERESFDFGKQEILTAFAKYLLQFVDDIRTKAKLRTYSAEKSKWIRN